MKHYCVDCGKLFLESDMILNEYHDGQDWYCKSCFERMKKQVNEMWEKIVEYASKQTTPGKNGFFTKED